MKSIVRMSVVLLGVLVVTAFVGMNSAFATSITYTTTGDFGGVPTTSITFDGGGGNTLTLTFAGVAGVTVDANPTTFGSLGTMTTSVTGTGATITNPTTLTITINQLAPAPTGGNPGIITGSLSGVITQNASSGQIDFTITSAVINSSSGPITYSAANDPLALVPASTNGGQTSIQGLITATTVPEPGSLLLLGTGMLGLAGFGVRKRMKK